MFKLYQLIMDEADGAGGDLGGAPAGDGKPTIEQLQEQLASMQANYESTAAENARLNAKIGEANKHAKAAERAAAEEARKKAEAEGNHEQLYRSAMEELEKERASRSEMENRIANEKRDAAAMKLAVELADGPNAKLLSRFIGERLKYTDEGVKVTDSNGNLTVSTLSDLANEFRGSADFSSLIRGNKASGGSATGADKKSGDSVPQITRAEFDAMNPYQRAEHFKKGGGAPTDD